MAGKVSLVAVAGGWDFLVSAISWSGVCREWAIPCTSIALVVGLSAANTRIPLARWVNLAGAPGRKELWSLSAPTATVTLLWTVRVACRHAAANTALAVARRVRGKEGVDIGRLDA